LGSVLSARYMSAMAIPPALAVPAAAGDSIDAALRAAQALPEPAAAQLLSLAYGAFDQAYGAVMLVAVLTVVAAGAAVLWLGRRAGTMVNATP
jgi:DHA2 family multidrug resistance protein-like MFS transporter